MSLEAEVRAGVGGLDLDASLAAAGSTTVVVVGPNGAGKTTLLRALAGLVPLEGGRVVLDGEVLEDAAAGIRIPPERRPVGFVFQESLLFPHLSVLDNVAFGLRGTGLRRRVAREAARALLERAALGELAAARPRSLSAGQARRAALVRALATGPRLLLLDEPFAPLDTAARARLRRDLRAELGGFSGVRIVVTHDPVEAVALGDVLVVLEGGRVVQAGPPAEVAARPRSAYVAELVGLNLLRGRGRGVRVELPSGAVLVAADPVEGEVLAVVHPRAVALHRAPPGGSPRNAFPGRVVSLEILGERVRVGVRGPAPLVAEVTLSATEELALVEGAEVWVSVKATEVLTYPA